MFSLWRKARRENSAASRLLGSTSLRFALHGWQRRKLANHAHSRSSSPGVKNPRRQALLMSSRIPATASRSETA
ncbi:hypothetical protein, partial [Thiolapillus sp.]|uniref:hypothetical protein n=1 Tax=Thiolapillus sp. TaxID=2017437 RepID=UPI003AF63F39